MELIAKVMAAYYSMGADVQSMGVTPHGKVCGCYLAYFSMGDDPVALYVTPHAKVCYEHV